MGSTDSVARSHAWVPDYTVKATTDVLFLKIRLMNHLMRRRDERGGGREKQICNLYI